MSPPREFASGCRARKKKNNFLKTRRSFMSTDSDRAYHLAHREERLMYKKNYYLGHREDLLAKGRAYHLVNREKDNARVRAHRLSHCEDRRAREKVLVLKRQHGLTPAEFESLLKIQGGVCAICKKSEWNGKRPHIDHDHRTGKIRGILCGKCNRALGFIDDDPDIALAIIEYLNKFKNKEDA